uniref:Uncharacterized protein n=1 Tax=Human betaherpesvirus 6 TaxID=10368 RepID=A0A5P9S5B2_9BETA|nr:hypothetical protein [Human betaherpesvirus 6]QFV26206.1 hypothetical protein [Human betaherpesvirus 6]QFV49789.1 hypothetical protein [Human betaherpesvirus 6]QFV49803.1 hypothetical protein [Human betaherpesvirus 6]QFX16100.1 hypothetical protein [Human betaherpesvirus 6]
MRHATHWPVDIGVRRRGSPGASRRRFRRKHRGPPSPFNHAVFPRSYDLSPPTRVLSVTFYRAAPPPTVSLTTSHTCCFACFLFISPPLPVTDQRTHCHSDVAGGELKKIT